MLDVRGLTVEYGANVVLRNFDLSIEPGETVGLIGPSGSGKSTAAWAILRLLSEQAVVHGSVCFRGRDLLAATERELQAIRGRSIAIVPQEPAAALNPVLSIGWQMEEVLRAHRSGPRAEWRDICLDMLERVELPAAVYRAYPHQLSGGQLQRVVLAQALLCKPSLLLADEPASALDTVTQTQVFSLLRSLQQEQNFAILLIAHDPGIVSAFASRVIVLKEGWVVEDGGLPQTFREPQHEFTRAMVQLWRC
jgi:ABC-type glutathione transport system ATPase component